MRSGITDRMRREQTITLFLDKAAFREQPGLPDEQTIYALLVDHAGTILWPQMDTLLRRKAAIWSVC